MSAGSVSTPSRTTTPTTTAKSPTSDTGVSKKDRDRVGGSQGTGPKTRNPDGTFRITSQLPSIPNAGAIAQAVTGEKDISGTKAAEAVMRAMHGDGRATSNRTTHEIRRDGSNVGSRDARQGVLEAERAEIAKRYANHPNGANSHAMQRVDKEIRANKAMNAVADTLHVLGADSYRVGVVEDEQRVRVVPDERLAGNAGYDKESHSILVSQSLADQAAVAAERLEALGILDSRGRIVKGREDDLDRNAWGDRLIKIGTLIAYHEQTHGEQDFIGGLGHFEEGARSYVEEHMGKYQENIGIAQQIGIPVDNASWSTTDEAWAVEHLRIHGEEYDAYLAQEQADIALGASVRVQLVTDAEGKPLERGQAVENILDMERGRSLRHGPDAGWIRDDVLRRIMDDAGTAPEQVPWDPASIAGHGATLVSEVPGWKRPGWKRPGWKRPGHLIEA